jgi:hypothetical protein
MLRFSNRVDTKNVVFVNRENDENFRENQWESFAKTKILAKSFAKTKFFFKNFWENENFSKTFVKMIIFGFKKYFDKASFQYFGGKFSENESFRENFRENEHFRANENFHENENIWRKLSRKKTFRNEIWRKFAHFVKFCCKPSQ